MFILLVYNVLFELGFFLSVQQTDMVTAVLMFLDFKV